jgi:hypothetical protein
MAKRKQKTEHQVVTQPTSRDHAPYWEVFFKYQRSPFLRSQLITALMAGKPLEVERLPPATLLDVVMLAMVTREYYHAEIIDDYQALLRRTDALWKEPMWTCKIFDQYHLHTADYVVRGSTELVCYEDQYLPSLVGWILEHDSPTYFAKELETVKEVTTFHKTS